MKLVHDRMFRAAMARQRGEKGWEADEAAAFAALPELVVGEMVPDGAAPSRCALDDQIVWGRSPVRLDLAGGWTDTPPYCLQHRLVDVHLWVELRLLPRDAALGEPARHRAGSRTRNGTSTCSSNSGSTSGA